MQTRLYIRNWARFQHYKDRCPPWIKLSTDTFQNLEFSQLEPASKLLAICIWTLASHSADGSVPDSLDYITQWGFLVGQVRQSNLEELIHQGFVSRVSEVLANCEQNASDSLERGEERREEDILHLNSIPVVAVIPESKINTSRNSKGASAFQIPAWIPQTQWNDFLEMRKRIRKPMTNRAKQLLVKRLEKLGGDSAAILEQSILNDWQSVWPLQEQGNGRYRGGKPKPTLDEIIELSKVPPNFG